VVWGGEFGRQPVAEYAEGTGRDHVHATILNRLGFDANRLTYFHGGLDRKLVGVEGAEPIHQLLA